MTTQKWKLVPVEPTPEMTDAWNNDDSDEFRHAYHVMLEAAPQPPKLHEPHEPIADCDCHQCAVAERNRLRQEVPMLRQEYAADTAEIERLKSRLADVEAINSIDARFCGRLALILECAILDPHGHFELACQLLEEYKAEWEKVKPSPPTFMGEPMPPERRARLLEMRAKRNEQEQSE